MVYTCYEMIRDCREDKPEGWAYFITHYVPAIRILAGHYGVDADEVIRGVRGSDLFRSVEPGPERYFVAALRQHMVNSVPLREPEIAIPLETLAAALAPLTVTEKQAAWFESMRYSPEETGPMLRMDPATVGAIREKAAELLRGHADAWRRDLIAENGPALGRAAAAARGGSCVTAKQIADIIDGRATWQARDMAERHMADCWHCVDHVCRLREAERVLRLSKPLEETEAPAYARMLGVPEAKRPFWQKILAR